MYLHLTCFTLILFKILEKPFRTHNIVYLVLFNLTANQAKRVAFKILVEKNSIMKTEENGRQARGSDGERYTSGSGYKTTA